MKINESKFKSIQIALLKQQLFEIRYNQASQVVKQALIDAGLDPNKKYSMNEEEFTIDEIL